MRKYKTKEEARIRIAELVQRFRQNEKDYLQGTYNETQVRTDFISPLLEAFGWDIYNLEEQPMAFREVIEEATVEVGEERLSKKPDYELRLARQRKFFVEAKKPSVRIDHEKAAAFQTRRYGYSASLPISILTNFYQLAIYDCRPIPEEGAEATIARHLIFRYDEFDEHFDELWLLLSRESIYSGEFDRYFAIDATRRGSNQFDDFFLRQVRSWRERLAINIHSNTPNLNSEELTYAVQVFLSRLVFLRVCEDREIERYLTLKNLPSLNTFEALMIELRRADEFYDSGLFRLFDDVRLGVRISDNVLYEIITELYYPLSPYTFAVVETQVLGEIYEQFLGEEITVTDNTVIISSKPEVRESGGVVPTPRHIADAIVERTLRSAMEGKNPDTLVDFTIIDICCGSGSFLLSAYDFVLNYYLDWYMINNQQVHIGRTIYEATAGEWRLTFAEKKRILLAHIRGVDIDPNAVEVARFSLLLKLIENESREKLQDHIYSTHAPALPDLNGTIRSGNSLVNPNEWRSIYGDSSQDLLERINPFSWEGEFPNEMAVGGFNVIVINPPYIRIQNMETFSPEEVDFYKSSDSPYLTGHQDNFDKYTLFIERALKLLRPNGRLGVIVPNKFMTIKSGRVLRRIITQGHYLEEVIHFGVKRVFGRKIANYTCILIMDPNDRENVKIELPGPIEGWRYGEQGTLTIIPSNTLTEEPWDFANIELRNLFDRIRGDFPNRLGLLSEIFVGVQTSADNIYIFHAASEENDLVTIHWNDIDWPIEKRILRPCMLDVTVNAYSKPEPNAWLIFPYNLIVGANGTQAHLIQPDEMLLRYPMCYAYLIARREELESRNIVGGSANERQFYQFGRSQSLTKFNSPKIILPALSIEPRYTFDNTNIVVTGGGNGPYYLIRQKDNNFATDYYLLAILNHQLSEAFIRNNTSVFGGGYYSHGKQFIENLPIPEPTYKDRVEIESLVEQIIEINEHIKTARTPHRKDLLKRQVNSLRELIEEKINTIFNLSSADIDIIRSVEIPS